MPPNPFDYSAYDRVVIGFHGTDEGSADRLVLGDPFKASDRDNEWFGQGIYFWEHAPKQASLWAKDVRKVETPAVVGALIRLGNCLDLLDSVNINTLKQFKTSLEAKFAEDDLPLPKNHRLYMKLDCTIFNASYATSDGQDFSIDSARAVYVPTETNKRFWERSWISEDTHIQICVCNTKNILAVWHARQDGRYGKQSKKAGEDAEG